jgi:hypothetical protein
VHVWAYPNPGSGQAPVFVGAAGYGGSRPDVGTAFGSQFTPSAFSLTASLAAGYYQVVVYAHSTVTGTFNQSQSVYLFVGANVVMAIDTPAEEATVSQPFSLSGYAFDASAPTGTGVPFVHVYAYLDGTGTGIWIGQADTGISRPDLGAWFQDDRSTPSGWMQSVSGLPPGHYYIVVYPYRSNLGTFGDPIGRWITVQ